MVDISERSLEATIQRALLAAGPDAVPGGASIGREHGLDYGEPWSSAHGGYRLRPPDEYDRALCLIPRDAVDFVIATQARTWQRLEEQYGNETKGRFLTRLAKEITTRGTLDVLRNGIKDAGCRFDLSYARPSSKLNPDVQNLYAERLLCRRPAPLQR